MTPSHLRSVPPPPEWASRLHSVGVTGTNGKTTTTTWLAYALADRPRACVRMTTLGTFVDAERIPAERTYAGMLGALRYALDRGARFVAMEMTSEALSKGYAKAWPCKVAVFTNLSHDHLNTHGSFEHYLASKAQLFLALPPGGAAVLNAACESYPLLKSVVPNGVRILSYAVPERGPPSLPGEPPFLRVERVEVDWRGTLVHYTCDDAAFPGVLRVPGHGSIFAENGVAALLGAYASGTSPETASQRIAEAPAPTGRFERIATEPDVIIDYAHTPDALDRTLRTARLLCRGRVILVFGAGGERDKEKRPLLGAASRTADTVILTSDNPRGEPSEAIAADVRTGLVGHQDVRTVLDRREAIASALALAEERDLVLIAGKGHETTQQIGDVRQAFSDHDVVRQHLTARATSSSRS